MALDIDTAFVEEFESGVHVAYQRQGSMLRNTVRTRSGVKNKTTFQKYGKGSATQKGRHSKIPAMNVAHDNVNVTVEDWFAGEWIDDLDLLRVNHDEMTAAQQAGAYALGRKTDEQLTVAMDTTTKETDLSSSYTIGDILGVMTKMGERDVPDDGQRYWPVSWLFWSKLLQIKEFASADYVGADQIPFGNGTTAKRWSSFMIMPFNGLDVANSKTKSFAYHSQAIGHAIGADVQTTMQYHNDYDSTFASNKMQMNAVLIDEEGCERVLLPTT